MKITKVLPIILSCSAIVFFGIILGYFLAYSRSETRQTYNYLPMTEKKFFEGFFLGNGTCKNQYKPEIKGLIVNHHLLAGQFIAQGLCRISTDKKITVVLLSPNHFARGSRAAISSAQGWYTP
ncbi:MAG: hypothetical protein WCO03_00655, partial [bacterium]